MGTRKPTPNQKFDWKDHPVVIASGSAAAAFLFAIALFTQVVSPTQTAKLEADLSKYKDAKEKAEIASKSLEGKVSSLEGKVSSLEAEIKNLKNEKSLTEQQLEESRAGNIFSPSNPYPNGLAAVKIGAQRDAVEKEYSSQSKKIDKEDPELLRVYLKNSPFETVVFFMTDKTPKAKISHISFDLPLFNSKYSEDFLFKKINENFGKPITDSSDKHYMWVVGSTYSIFSYNKTGYVLMPRGMEPDLGSLGKELMAWHSQRPNISYSETRIFDKYFEQLFKRDYSPDRVAALHDWMQLIYAGWGKDNPHGLNETLLAMRSYAPFHHLYAVSMCFAVASKHIDRVPAPDVAWKRARDKQVTEWVISVAATALNFALEAAANEPQGGGKVFSPVNWIKTKACLSGITNAIQMQLMMMPNMPGGKEKRDALILEAETFEYRWQAD